MLFSLRRDTTCSISVINSTTVCPGRDLHPKNWLHSREALSVADFEYVSPFSSTFLDLRYRTSAILIFPPCCLD